MFVPISIVVICSTLLSKTLAFPSGAHNNASNPMDALSSYCTSGHFRPNHGDFLPQSSVAPYTINVSSPAGNIYRPGQVVTVTIEGNKTPSPQTFKGFFIQGDATEAAFAGDITCGANGKKVTFCGKVGATHVNGQPKDKVTCQWTPPDYQIGRVQFVATIVGNFSTFWTGVKSPTTLTTDPSTMSYKEKSRQMREQMMRQFQQSAQGFGNLMGQQAGVNPFAHLLNMGH